MSTMRRRKEQQQKNDGAQPPDSEGLKQDSALEDKRRHTPLKNNDSLTEDNRNMILPIILILCRLCGCILLAYGMYLGQTEICTHDECDMTFSMRQFLELDMKRSRSISLSQYRLFKFIDQRDPRHSRFRRYEQPLQGKEWCLDPAQTTAVLYVPGHGGSYEQSRSLGAHGLQLTQRQNAGQPRRIFHALQNNLLTGNATHLEAFVFDVYALDFGEEGAGLHGRLVEQQSSMVADAVEFLIETCELSSVTIVAHSIGGYATRLALVDYPELPNMVRNVITLATPHAYPVLAIEPSLHRVFSRFGQEQNTQVALISIGGGWRDEMIPPRSCQAPNALNLGAVDIMSNGRKTVPLLGMDHRAIVWCHNLLSKVREIIFTLNRNDDKDAPIRLREVANRLEIPSDYNYLDSVERTRMVYVESFGWWRSILAENGLLYMIEHLVGLYALSSALYFLWGVSSRSSVAIVCLAPLLLRQTLPSDSLSWGSMYILSLVANTVFILLLVCAQKICAFVDPIRCSNTTSFVFGVFLFFTMLLLSVSLLFSRQSLYEPERLGQIIALALVPTIIVQQFSWNSPSPRKDIYSAWILVVLPLFSAGLFYATMIQQISAPVIDFGTAILPIAVLPLLRAQSSPVSAMLSLTNAVRAACMIVALTCLPSPGAGTLRMIALLPIFGLIDVLVHPLGYMV